MLHTKHGSELDAELEVTMKRAIGRSKLDIQTNIELVEAMWEQFNNLGTYESHVIDTTDCSIKDTVLIIKENIANKTNML